jgi:N-acetylmuramic acid 6-phosphate etherase
MKNDSKLFSQLSSLTTERLNRRTSNIDAMTVPDILLAINREDKKVAAAVALEIPWITRAVDLVVRAFRNGGRLIYVGAGTSGRLGILDASECPPTYGIDPGMVSGFMAGGKSAVFRSKEGAEDRLQEGVKLIRSAKVGKNDVVCGIAASIRTPYVTGALREAKSRGAVTLLVTTNPRSQLQSREFSNIRNVVDVAICPVVGPEAIMGSTRMKAGTAQKLVLNMITTSSMIRLGKVYGNLMVDLKMNSRKLEERAKRVLMIATGVGYADAARILGEAGGHVKTAIVMVKKNCSPVEARRQLKKASGMVRVALSEKAVSDRHRKQ